MDVKKHDLLEVFAISAAEVSQDGCVPKLTLDTPLAELAFDSVQLAELVSAMGERTGTRATPDRFYAAETVGDVIAVLGAELEE